jgi:hypothetical protein
MSVFMTGDEGSDAARQEVLEQDAARAAPAPPGGAQAATAAAMQNQHVADEVSGAARRMYLDIPGDVMAKVTPFERYEVVDLMTQVRHRSSVSIA